MKLFVASLLIAACAAAPAPVIRLSPTTPGGKLANPIYRPHDLKLIQPDGSIVKSRQDYTQRCPASKSTNHLNCPFPHPKGYDHQDHQLKVKTRVFLVNMDGRKTNIQIHNNQRNKLYRSVNFAKRSVYLFKYDTIDKAGNNAEQAVWGLILDDLVKPTIKMCGAIAENWEAASYRSLCGTSVAFDNYDPITAKNLRYTIQHMRSRTYLCSRCTYAKAKKAITTTLTGRFLVTLSVHDFAGFYGRNGKNNWNTAHKAVLVRDTQKPWIRIRGCTRCKHQCNTRFNHLGAIAYDKLDTIALGRKIHVTSRSNLVHNKRGHYHIKYDANDRAGNDAVRRTRHIDVIDTLKPNLTIKGRKQVIHYSGWKFKDAGATCWDVCDKHLKAVTMKWSRPWNDKKIGVYHRYYTCCDASRNCVKKSRKFTVIDKTMPIITCKGKCYQVHEATHDKRYRDAGATCTDYVDGNLDHKVKTSGQIVSFAIPGRYIIRYDCMDKSGNKAVPVNRTVIVRDTRCPRIAMKGASVKYIEAGFRYTDAGAIATDDLDGKVSVKVSGDTVNTARSFYARRSCRHVQQTCKDCKTGSYYITTYAHYRKAYSRTHVFCDMTKFTGFTYKKVQMGIRVKKAYNKYQGSCYKYGLKMVVWESKYQKARAMKIFGKAYFASGSTNYYLCGANDGQIKYKELPKLQAFTRGHQLITRAEQGEYHIHYTAIDRAGNKQCKQRVRTVVVKDTLPPVITLHLKKTLIHVSDYKQRGIGGVRNPAGPQRSSYKKNPFLSSKYRPNILVANKFMAEQAQTASVNGWIIGAAASAVTGLALMAYGKKQ